MRLTRFAELIGVELSPASHAERWISGLGGVLAIASIIYVSQTILGDDAMLIVASMGAATVLLFAVPHGPLSQPWPLFGGNLISAFIGVSCTKLVADPLFAAALAVGISVGVMYYLRCVHPPGGATALAAVISGPTVDALGYQYLLTPVLINVSVTFVIALIFNYPFRWRRYPASMAPKPPAGKESHLSHSSIEHAMKQIDAFIDVSEEDLNRIYTLASEFDRRHPHGKA